MLPTFAYLYAAGHLGDVSYSDQLLFNTGDTTRQESSQAHVKEQSLPVKRHQCFESRNMANEVCSIRRSRYT